jgi:hypothetical protein
MNPLSNGWCLVVKNDFTSANSFLEGVDIKLKIRCPERSDYDKNDVKKVSGNTEVVTCVKN